MEGNEEKEGKMVEDECWIGSSLTGSALVLTSR